MSRYIIEAESLSYTYANGTKALQDISFKVPIRSKVAVLGANGSGKTTLFKCLNGIIKPNQGRLLYNSEPMQYDKASLRTLRSKLGIVFQDPETQLFSANVLQDVAFGPLNLGLSQKEALRRTEAALVRTGIADLYQCATHLLSYGQKKRVAVAGIVAMQPEVMVSDEPTASLDLEHAEKIMALYDCLNDSGTTIIISTHDTDLALQFADQVIILKNGSVLCVGKPKDIFLDEQLLFKAGLRRPLLLDIFLMLRAQGLVPQNGTVPRSLDELTMLLKVGASI